jgi:hypothetical protein
MMRPRLLSVLMRVLPGPLLLFLFRHQNASFVFFALLCVRRFTTAPITSEFCGGQKLGERTPRFSYFFELCSSFSLLSKSSSTVRSSPSACDGTGRCSAAMFLSGCVDLVCSLILSRTTGLDECFNHASVVRLRVKIQPKT